MNPRFFYLRDENNTRVACVASRLSEDRVEFALSTWNPIDPFDKSIAKQIAEGRLKAGKIYSIEFQRETVKREIITTILSNTHSPTRAREAAKRWLKTHSG